MSHLNYHLRSKRGKNLNIQSILPDLIEIIISDDYSSFESIKLERSELTPVMMTLFAWLRPNPLRALTSMTHEEFTEFFGRGYHASYMDEKIASFHGLHGLHKFLSEHGLYDSYLKMMHAGFDVTFTLDRKGGEGL